MKDLEKEVEELIKLFEPFANNWDHEKSEPTFKNNVINICIINTNIAINELEWSKNQTPVLSYYRKYFNSRITEKQEILEILKSKL